MNTYCKNECLDRGSAICEQPGLASNVLFGSKLAGAAIISYMSGIGAALSGQSLDGFDGTLRAVRESRDTVNTQINACVAVHQGLSEADNLLPPS